MRYEYIYFKSNAPRLALPPKLGCVFCQKLYAVILLFACFRRAQVPMSILQIRIDSLAFFYSVD